MARSAASLDLESSLWRYAVDLYERPGVSRALLQLQDRHGVDVCVLLAMLFAGDRLGLDVDAALTGTADDKIRAWRDEVVTPLRHARRAVRRYDAGAGGEGALYDAIKRTELLAEQVELARLARWLEGEAGRSRERDGPGIALRAIVVDVVNFYSAERPDEPYDQEIDFIMDSMA